MWLLVGLSAWPFRFASRPSLQGRAKGDRTRRIGSRVLIPYAELERFGADNPLLQTGSDPDLRLLYDRKSAAERLSISVRSLDYFIEREEIKIRRVNSCVLIPRAELARFARADHHSPVQSVQGK